MDCSLLSMVCRAYRLVHAAAGPPPVALRLALLPHHPVPTPDVYDEFCHLLVADTLRHFRLANPAHALRQFFETFFVLQEPTYSSIYPLGQGLAMAVGWMIFGLPWAGVLAGSGGFLLALLLDAARLDHPGLGAGGGLLAVMEFGPLSQWMNSYWGGALAAAAGCLVFGSLPRLRARGRPRDALLLGRASGLHLLTRQYESIFLIFAVVLLLPSGDAKTGPIRPIAKLAATVVWRCFPPFSDAPAEQAGHRQLDHAARNAQPIPIWRAGVAHLPSPASPAPATYPQQAMDYKMQLSFHKGAETIGSYFERLEYRVRFYRFFFLASALPGRRGVLLRACGSTASSGWL